MMESASVGRPAHMMGFTDAVRNALMNNYVNFNGRASRSEYWWFALFAIIVSFIATALEIAAGVAFLNIIFSLAIFLPYLGLGFRRLHDLGKSGWWLLISFIPILGFIVLLVFFVMEGENHPNQYGEVPTNTIKQDERYSQ